MAAKHACCRALPLMLVIGLSACARRDGVRITLESPNEPYLSFGPSDVLVAVEQSGLLAGNESVEETRLIAWCAKASIEARPPNVMNEAVILTLTRVADAPARWRILYIQGCCPSDWEPGMSSRSMPCERTYESAPTDTQIAEFIHDSNFGLNECYPDQEVLRICLFMPSEKIRGAVTKGITEVEREERYVSVGEIYFG